MKNLILILIVFTSTISFSADSTRIDTSYHHVRKKALLWSTFLPGAGQIYNEFGYRKVQGKAHKSWWRAPIIIAGLGFTGYLTYTNGSQAKALKTEWLYRDITGLEKNFIGFTPNELLVGTATTYGFNDRAKYRDYAIAGFVLIYGMNLIDAFVDAHFVTFNVSQNLQFAVRPKVFPTNDLGLSLALKIN